MRTLIGAAASSLGMNPRTLRYYERLGLLPAAGRTSSGYRVYDEQSARQLAFIVKAKGLGLTLAEIRQIVALRDRGEQPCASVQRLLRDHVRRVNDQIAQLQGLRRDLTTLLRRWGVAPARSGRGVVCPRIEAYGRTARHHAATRKGGHAR